MFDIYVYNADNGELVGVDPAYAADSYKAAAQRWIDRGCTVKIVDTYDVSWSTRWGDNFFVLRILYQLNWYVMIYFIVKFKLFWFKINI